MYCTEAQAVAAGALGTSEEVLAAIAAARVRIDEFTRVWWEPTAATISARVSGSGWIGLPQQVQSVTSVTVEGATDPIDSSAYVVRSSTVPGSSDAVILRTIGANAIVAGAEPWVGGYANLAASIGTVRVSVVGSFGRADTPREVTDACAALAAWLTQPETTAGPTIESVDVEGNALVIDATPEVQALPMRTTGVASVDEALTPLILGGRVRFS